MFTAESFWRSVQQHRASEITRDQADQARDARKSEAKRALIGAAMLTEGQAKLVVSAISRGEIPHIVLEP